jgi:hypothetical protein
VHFELRRADLTCLHHQNKWSGKYSHRSSGAWWNHTCTRTDTFAFTLTFANSDTFAFFDTHIFTFFDIHTFADANAIAFTSSDAHKDRRSIMDKDEAEPPARMIAGKWHVQLSRRRRKNIVFTLKRRKH